MKQLLLLSFLLFSFFVNAQLSGNLANDKRAVLRDFYFEIEGHKAGELVFSITVDETGHVVACQLDKAASSGYSTPTMVKAINHIKANLQFVAGSEYPQFHTGTVKITVVKP
ncbi:MAG: hypothetical protein R3279_10725 [Putridiphycobacter sp.]|nr:hypothetical protein [Putridiphycobacter sp.]